MRTFPPKASCLRKPEAGGKINRGTAVVLVPLYETAPGTARAVWCFSRRSVRECRARLFQKINPVTCAYKSQRKLITRESEECAKQVGKTIHSNGYNFNSLVNSGGSVGHLGKADIAKDVKLYFI